MRLSDAIRSVAILEALKGLVVLLAGLGLISLVHHNVQEVAAHWIEHAHLNPASHYPRIFLDAASRLTDPKLWLYAAGAAIYAGVSLLEAYGLFRARPWAEWLAALSGGLYVPIELFELYKRVSWPGLLLLVVNLLVVALVLQAVCLRKKYGRNAV